jgi:hypothetical protein
MATPLDALIAQLTTMAGHINTMTTNINITTQVTNLTTQVAATNTAINTYIGALPAALPALGAARPPKPPKPHDYDGSHERANAVLYELNLYCTQWPDDEARVRNVFPFFTEGKALQWADAKRREYDIIAAAIVAGTPPPPPPFTDWHDFRTKFRDYFEDPFPVESALGFLKKSRIPNDYKMVDEFILVFEQKAAIAGIDEMSQIGLLQDVLPSQVYQKVLEQGAANIAEWKDKAKKIDRAWREANEQRSRHDLKWKEKRDASRTSQQKQQQPA